jgi:hypothetical protein
LRTFSRSTCACGGGVKARSNHQAAIPSSKGPANGHQGLLPPTPLQSTPPASHLVVLQHGAQPGRQLPQLPAALQQRVHHGHGVSATAAAAAAARPPTGPVPAAAALPGSAAGVPLVVLLLRLAAHRRQLADGAVLDSGPGPGPGGAIGAALCGRVRLGAAGGGNSWRQALGAARRWRPCCCCRRWQRQGGRRRQSCCVGAGAVGRALWPGLLLRRVHCRDLLVCRHVLLGCRGEGGGQGAAGRRLVSARSRSWSGLHGRGRPAAGRDSSHCGGLWRQALRPWHQVRRCRRGLEAAAARRPPPAARRPGPPPTCRSCSMPSDLRPGAAAGFSACWWWAELDMAALAGLIGAALDWVRGGRLLPR